MMKLGKIVKIVGGITAISTIAIGAIMLIGKKALNKHVKEAVVVETALGESAEEATVVTADVEENTPEPFAAADEEQPKTPE